MKTKTSFVRRCVDFAGWIIPGAILALIPKCPMCLAAYIVAWTGIGLSFTAATYLRTALLVLCAGLILFFSARPTKIMSSTCRLVRRAIETNKLQSAQS
jgi:hypothetical protein